MPTPILKMKWTHYLWEFLMLFPVVFCGFLAEKKRKARTHNKGLSAMNQETKNMEVHHHPHVEKKGFKEYST
jgi:hypothetical protein